MHELRQMFTKTQRVENCLHSKNECCLAIGKIWWQQEMFLLLLPHLWEHMGKKCFLSEIMKASVCLTRNSTLTTENILTAWENFNRTIGRVLLTCSLQTLHSSKESGSELSPRPLPCLFLLTTL